MVTGAKTFHNRLGAMGTPTDSGDVYFEIGFELSLARREAKPVALAPAFAGRGLG